MKLTGFLVVLILHLSLKAQDLVLPIEGEYGDDYIIVNYPDWHLEDGPVHVEDGALRDFNCFTKTYDGHQGTDFVIRSFTQMDSLVNVLAIADGEIIHVTEDLYDRETEGDIALGLGNYVGIYHPSTDTYSYYAHLKTNSVPVEVGEFVSGGQVIGQVGSSGNSTDPHLHFELWNPGVLTDPAIDPWGTPCGEGTNLWSSSPEYDTSYAVWECGLVNYDSVSNFVPYTWYPLRERLDLKTGFTADDPYFTFWALHYGLKVGDEVQIEWYDPSGEVYAESTTTFTDRDWWFHYYNHSIPTPPLTEQGIWTIQLYYNDSLVLTKNFPFGHLSTEQSNPTFFEPYVYQTNDQMINIVIGENHNYNEIWVYDLNGKLIETKSINPTEERITIDFQSTLSNEVYIIRLVGVQRISDLKIVMH